jgi:hypothetical protein
MKTTPVRAHTRSHSVPASDLRYSETKGQLREFTTNKDMKDMKGWGIPKGTILHVMKETTLKNPMDGTTSTFMVVRVDNGTGHINLMPETAIKVPK